MSDYEIMAIANIVRRAERDHKAGIALSAHNYPHHSEALKTHQAVYARLNQQGNHVPVAAGRVDLAQVMP